MIMDINQVNINRIINKIDENSDVELIKEYYNNLKESYNHQSLLHLFVKNKYDEKKCLLAIQLLLDANINPNFLDRNNNNFIQAAINTGYSPKFIYQITEDSFNHHLYRNYYKKSIIASAIKSKSYKEEELEDLYCLLADYNYDVHENLETLMKKSNYYTNEEIAKFKNFVANDKLDYYKMLKEKIFLIGRIEKQKNKELNITDEKKVINFSELNNIKCFNEENLEKSNNTPKQYGKVIYYNFNKN